MSLGMCYFTVEFMALIATHPIVDLHYSNYFITEKKKKSVIKMILVHIVSKSCGLTVLPCDLELSYIDELFRLTRNLIMKPVC